MKFKILFILLLSFGTHAQIKPALFQFKTDTVLQWHYHFGDEFSTQEVDQTKWYPRYPWGGLLLDQSQWAVPEMLTQKNGWLHLSAKEFGQKAAVPTVSLVGYTNAGKSTLFNALTKAGTYAADQLFATLDTTSRRVYLPEIGNAVVSDTVGFIRDLPHQLVEAFRATLDETVRADLLLHVVDASSFDREQQMIEVDKVLAEIGADQSPQLVVVNKIDQVPALMERGPVLRYDRNGKVAAIYISAKEGIGLDVLRETLAELAKNTDRMKAPVEEVPSVAEMDPQAPAKRWESLDVFHTRTGLYSPNDA